MMPFSMLMMGNAGTGGTAGHLRSVDESPSGIGLLLSTMPMPVSPMQLAPMQQSVQPAVPGALPSSATAQIAALRDAQGQPP